MGTGHETPVCRVPTVSLAWRELMESTKEETWDMVGTKTKVHQHKGHELEAKNGTSLFVALLSLSC